VDGGDGFPSEVQAVDRNEGADRLDQVLKEPRLRLSQQIVDRLEVGGQCHGGDYSEVSLTVRELWEWLGSLPASQQSAPVDLSWPGGLDDLREAKVINQAGQIRVILDTAGVRRKQLRRAAKPRRPKSE
jgi:hypothetical protein